MLQRNTVLQYLDIGSNGLGDNFIIAMSSYLPSNKALKELVIDNNWITDNGIHELAQALRYNTTLQKLNLSKNYITDVGIIQLFNTLEYNTSLTTLIVLNRFNIAISNNLIDTNNNTISSNSLLVPLEISTLQCIIQSLQYNDTLTTFMHTNDSNHLMMEWNDEIVVDVNGTDGTNTQLQLRRQIQSILEQNHLQTRTAPYKGTRNRTDIYQWLLQQSDDWNLFCSNSIV